MYADCAIFILYMAPFVSQSYELTLFKIVFPPFSPKQQTEALGILVAFLKPTIMSTCILFGRGVMGLVSYQPNLVIRQFNFNQFLPKSFFCNRVEIFLTTTELVEEEHQSCLDLHSKEVVTLTPLKFQASYLCTQQFEELWPSFHLALS